MPRFRYGFSIVEGDLIVDGVAYTGRMPDESRVVYNEIDVTSMGDTISTKLADSIEDIELRWGSDWCRSTEEAVAAGVLTPKVGEGVWADLLDAAEELSAEDMAVAGLIAWARTQTWSNFLQSICEFYDERGFLTPRQIETAVAIREKRESVKKAKAKPVKSPKAAPTPSPTPMLGTGLYRQSTGTLYRAHRETAQLFVADPPGYGEYFEWFPVIDGKDLPDDVTYLTADNIVGFGVLMGTCLMCGSPLSEDNDEGLHDACAALVYGSYGYRPPVSGSYGDE